MPAARRLYLDDAAATEVDPLIVRAMAPYQTQVFGNPASLHAEGVAARQAVAAARKTLAECLEAHADEIVFTGGGTEANNLALFGTAAAQSDRRHLVISAIEHPSVSEAAAELEQRGCAVTRVSVTPDGLVDPAAVIRAISSQTFLVSITFASGEIGTIQPITEIGKFCAKRGILFHTDACQAAAWLPLRVEALHVDLMTVNAAKMHGPKGIGLLYRRRGVRLKPMLFGGGQEGGFRSGTENVPGIVGFAEAFRLTRQRLPQVLAVIEVRDKLIQALCRLPGVRLIGHPQQRLPNHVSVSVAGVDGETLVLGLDAAGIACSSGSACSSLHPIRDRVSNGVHREGSPALKALGPSTGGNVRFTLDWTTRSSDVYRVVRTLRQVIDRQRPLTKIWPAAVREGKRRHASHA